MAIWVIKVPREGYKIRYIVGQKSTLLQENYFIYWIDIVSSRQKLGIILEIFFLYPSLGNFTTHIAIVWGRLVWDNDVLLPNNVNKMKLAKSLLACKAHICANTVAVTYQKTVIGH